MCQHYPDCEYYTTPAEEMTGLEDARFDLIHGREVYPVTRTDSLEYQAAFLGALARRLTPTGVILLQMVHVARGLGNTYTQIGPNLRAQGLGEVERYVMGPRRAVRVLGPLSYWGFMRGFLKWTVMRLCPQKTTYFYLIRRV